jgi:23S rRNA (adenine1618-N6)-methyltransferase
VLDIGTGASAIYPLLGAATRADWTFVGTDVTDVALACAQENLRKQDVGIRERITFRDARCATGSIETSGENVDDPQIGILRGVVREDEEFTFCMCNPPFFESIKDAESNPNTACGGTEIEMVCPGGEEAFTERMFLESLGMKHRVHWFTTMCGKKKTMTKLRARMHAARVPAIRTTELVHGKTSRWCIAWSFSKDAARKANVPLPDPEKLALVRAALLGKK